MSFVFQKMTDRMPQSWGGKIPSLVGFTSLQRAVFHLMWSKFTVLHHNVFYYCTGTYYCS